MTISNEAVEATAKAFSPNAWDPTALLFVAHGETLEASRKRAQEAARSEARAALVAAAPIIRAECLEAAAAAWDTRSVTFLETMKGMAESRDYTHDDIIRYGAYSAEAQTTAARLRARAVAERGRQ